MKKIISGLTLLALIGCSNSSGNSSNAIGVSGNAFNQSFGSVAPVITSFSGMIPFSLRVASKQKIDSPRSGSEYAADWDTTDLEPLPGSGDAIAIRDWISNRLSTQVENSPLANIKFLLNQFCIAGVLAGTTNLDGSYYPPDGTNTVTFTNELSTSIISSCDMDISSNVGGDFTISVGTIGDCKNNLNCRSDLQYEKYIQMSYPAGKSSRIGQNTYLFYLKKTAETVHFAVNNADLSKAPRNSIGYRLLADQNTSTQVTKFEFVSEDSAAGTKTAKSSRTGFPIYAYRLYLDGLNNQGYILADDNYSELDCKASKGCKTTMVQSIHQFLLSGRPNSTGNKTNISSYFRTAVGQDTPKLRNACVTVADATIGPDDDGVFCAPSATEIAGVSLEDATHLGQEIVESFNANHCTEIIPIATTIQFGADDIHTKAWCHNFTDVSGPTIENGFDDPLNLAHSDSTSIQIFMSEQIKTGSLSTADLVLSSGACATVTNAETNSTFIQFTLDTSACEDIATFNVTFDPASVTDLADNPGEGDVISTVATVRFTGPAITSASPEASNDLKYVPTDFFFNMDQAVTADSVTTDDLFVDVGVKNGRSTPCAVVTGATAHEGIKDTSGHQIHFTVDSSACVDGDTLFIAFDPSHVQNVNGTDGVGDDAVWNITVDKLGPTIVDTNPSTAGSLSEIPAVINVVMSEAINPNTLNSTMLATSNPCINVDSVTIDNDNASQINFALTGTSCPPSTDITLTFDPANVTDITGGSTQNSGTGDPIVFTINLPEKHVKLAKKL